VTKKTSKPFKKMKGQWNLPGNGTKPRQGKRQKNPGHHEKELDHN
jgi:hypothetical protein